MASLQTSAILSSPNAANAAMKASTQSPGNDNSDFAAMLNGAAPKPAQKSQVQPKPADNKSAASASHVKDKRDDKRDAGTDNKADNKPDRKTAAKANAPANGKADSAKPDATLQQQAAANGAVQDSDGADDNSDTATQTAAQTEAQAPQAPPPQQPQPDASAQAQQMLAAATPPAGAQAAAATDTAQTSDNNNVAGAGPTAKAARTQTPRAPAAQNPSPGPAPAAGATGTAADPAAGAAKPDTSEMQAILKAAGHQNDKSQTVDAAKSDPSQSVIVSEATPQPAPPAPPPQPAPTAANVAGMTAAAPAANTAGVSANAGLATSLHVAPQGPTPNVNSLAVEIAARSQSGAKEFQIRLDPPELGHVEVRLSIDASGKAEAHMSADQQQTLDLLQKNSPSLTSALRDAGLDVSQSGLNFSLRGQDRQGGDNSNGGAQTGGPSTSLAATKTIDAAGAANAYLSSAGDARLDIHV